MNVKNAITKIACTYFYLCVDSGFKHEQKLKYCCGCWRKLKDIQLIIVYTFGNAI